MTDLLKNIVFSLKQSLVYTLSLGDKELFHSNVLGWLLENHNEKGIQPVVKLFINDELEIERVEREKNHFDFASEARKKNDFVLVFSFYDRMIRRVWMNAAGEMFWMPFCPPAFYLPTEVLPC